MAGAAAELFDQPRTFVAEVKGVRLAVVGFPSERDNARARFADLVAATDYTDVSADIRLLCLHQCMEGVTVGPANYTFTTAPDVIRASDIPRGFSAVLSGHMHRQEVLTTDLRGTPRTAPVLHPGSIERTSVAEGDEETGFMIVECICHDDVVNVRWEFRQLPARPLIRHDLQLDGMNAAQVEEAWRVSAAEWPLTRRL